MDATTASLLGAAIGALSGLGGGYLTTRRQAQIEQAKWSQARLDDQEKALRLAIAELAKKLAIGTHTIAWFTWKAKFAPKTLTDDDIAVYNRDMKTLFPEIVGARVVVIALSQAAHNTVSPIIERLYGLDFKIGETALKFEEAPQDSIAELARCYDTGLKLDKDIMRTVSEITGLHEC